MSDKQIQKAGDYTQQIQATNLNFNFGIEEKRAREICAEMLEIAKKEFTDEAIRIAKERVESFENHLIPKMAQINGAMEFFAKPEFQLLLVDAQKSVMASEREDEIGLISELLMHRIQNGEKRETRAGIKRAIQIVNDVSDEGLLALTLATAIQGILPNSSSILNGLDILNTLFEKLCYGQLPSNFDWLDHLDIMDAIRISPTQRLKKLSEFYFDFLSGYCVVGIKKDSENYSKSIEMLQSVGLSRYSLIDHELLDGYARLPLVEKAQIKDLKLSVEISSSNSLNGIQVYKNIPITAEQEKVLTDIYNLYDSSSEMQRKLRENFNKEFNSRSNLFSIAQWWDNLPYSFSITAVGRVLAYTNAKRCDKSIPPLY